MRAPVLCLLICASPSAFAEDAGLGAVDASSSLLVLDLKPTNAPPELSELVTELVAVSLANRPGLRVLTSADVRSALAVEQEKQALGCEDDSCLAEIAGAMGADYVVHGSVGVLADFTLVTLNLFDSSSAVSVGREQVQVEDRGELPAAIERAARDLVAELRGKDGAKLVVEQEAAASSPLMSPLFLVGAPVAAVAGVGALGLGAGAGYQSGQYADGSILFEERETARALGQGLFIGAVVAGGVAVVGGVVAALAFVLE